MGRTARGIDGKGHALLILRPEELGFLRFLKQARVGPPTAAVEWRLIFSREKLCPYLGTHRIRAVLKIAKTTHTAGSSEEKIYQIRHRSERLHFGEHTNIIGCFVFCHSGEMLKLA